VKRTYSVTMSDGEFCMWTRAVHKC